MPPRARSICQARLAWLYLSLTRRLDNFNRSLFPTSISWSSMWVATCSACVSIVFSTMSRTWPMLGLILLIRIHNKLTVALLTSSIDACVWLEVVVCGFSALSFYVLLWCIVNCTDRAMTHNISFFLLST